MKLINSIKYKDRTSVFVFFIVKDSIGKWSDWRVL
ncbi:hypothetical protein J2810_000018 [Chryseobacterium rhizosphaerae]|nr:hypothetical protein [Chryseobacterium rhizosphaerae]